MINSESDAIAALEKLNDALNSLKRPTEMNIFDAVGMATQEIKHSAFLAWLLDPKQTHGMGNVFLLDFVDAVWNYVSVTNSIDIPSNRSILSKDYNIEQLIGFSKAQDIEVITEKVVSNPESRIDIFIQSRLADTTMVIENKVFTSTHDDQLKRYEKEVEAFGGKKIFIYLTPQGDLPTSIDGRYQDGWCIISYKAIIEFLSCYLKKTSVVKLNNKTKNLIGDYINMVDDKILHNNKTIRARCNEIRRNHAEALEILMNYTDNVKDVCRYISETWLPLNVGEVPLRRSGDRKLVFYTRAIEQFYARHGQKMAVSDKIYRFQISFSSKDGPITLGMWLAKNSEEEWTSADIKIRDILQSNKKMGEKYCTLYSVELLSSEERDINFDDNEKLKAKIDNKLEEFIGKLRWFERTLDNL